MDAFTFLDAVTGAARAGNADRSVKLGTVDPAYAGPPNLPKVTFDGESVMSVRTYACLRAPSPGDRVALLPVGSTYVIVGSLGATYSTPRGIIARHRRLTASTPAATAQSVVRLDDVPLLAGRSYKIWTNSLLIFSSTTATSGSARISYTTDGSTPTTASPLLNITNTAIIATTGDGQTVPLVAYYTPATDLLLSLLLFTIRTSGTGNISLSVSSSHLIELFVEDLGFAPASSGTNL